LTISPSKRLGQNFLQDAQLAEEIVNNLASQSGEPLVEIGPGLGALTVHLLKIDAPLTLIEFDRTIAADLRTRLADRPRTTVIEADAAQFDFGHFIPGGPFQLIGNLPYSSATPIIASWLDPALPITRAVVMVQKEVAERLAAPPDCHDYGNLSVRVQRRFEVRIVKIVPPDVFKPRPKVDSALVVLTPHLPPGPPPCRTRTLERLLKAGFSQRRKQLGKLLAGVNVDWEAGAAFLGANLQARAEDLTVSEWVRLARWADGIPEQIVDTSQEEFDVVDERDEVIGVRSRRQVHEEGLRHRAVHLLIRNRAGEILLQLRSAWKDRHPGVWDSSAAGHVTSGDDYLPTVRREVIEELGVEVEPRLIARIEAGPETGMEFVRLYTAEHEGPFRPDPDEIDAVRFFAPEVITEWLVQRPEDFAPGFIRCFREASAFRD